MPTYLNHNQYAVHLTGPDGGTITIKPGAKHSLSQFYERYVARGFIKRVSDQQTYAAVEPSMMQPANLQMEAARKILEARKNAKPKIPIRRAQQIIQPQQLQQPRQQQTVVGKRVREDGHAILAENCNKGGYPISDGIGVGILTYNRWRSLKRLVDSISANTNLLRTTVIISDDCSDDPETIAYLDTLSRRGDLVVLRNQERAGVAGNSNRLLACLDRFKHKLLLNDDVEVLRRDWERFYPGASASTGMQHFCYRQLGVYSAKPGDVAVASGVGLRIVRERPHGAVMYISDKAFREVGYFDESFGQYGLEHVDWSTKVWEFGLQAPGYCDVEDSDKYFKVHQERSSDDRRVQNYRYAKEIHLQRYGTEMPHNRTTKGEFVASSKYADAVPSVSYVVPVRDTGRTGCVATVVNNIRAQRFPRIQIVVSEQDTQQRLSPEAVGPVTYRFTGPGNSGNPLFNKAIAFNVGVSLTKCEKVVLHDADTMAPSGYTAAVCSILDENAACHVGSRVIYADERSTSEIVAHSDASRASIERVVGYYEGGSLACHRDVYWAVGGFDEGFWGYGCEDCEFYRRLSTLSNPWYGERSVDLLHLWHSRVPGWNEAHEANKALDARLRSMDIVEYLRVQRSKIEHYLGPVT